MLFRRLCLRLRSYRYLGWKRSALRCSLVRVMAISAVFALLSLLYVSYRLTYFTQFSLLRVKIKPPKPLRFCEDINESRRDVRPQHFYSHKHASLTDNKVLVVVDTQYTKLGHNIAHILEANRFRFRVDISGKSLPSLTHNDRGKFALVIFENFSSYLFMDNWNRELLDKYCREYHVNIIAFCPAIDDSLDVVELENFPLQLLYNVALRDYYLNPYSSIWRITKPRDTYNHDLPGEDWTIFQTNHSTYQAVAYARRRFNFLTDKPTSNDTSFYTTVIHDTGTFDGIQRILFGSGLSFWMHKLIFIDSIMFLSHGKLGTSLDRLIQIDIDDIFVGHSGVRMNADDADALVAGQERLQKSVKGFRFNLGFSGKYFLNGNNEEDEGDIRLLEHSGHFWWFDHSWRHLQPHISDNLTALIDDLTLNKDFSQRYGLPTVNNYAIAPHHSGVYPVHEQLYDAWKEIWDIKVTSTEEYPHLRPARMRQGFIYRGIMVLPRQTCGLFTHTVSLDKYPGGRQRLDTSIQGGELFDTFLYNPINVYMTHMSNYGNDRLGLYTFESAVKFVQCWTNLRLRTVPPIQLANAYFSHYPDQRDPIWQNPCNDKRHLEIWSVNKSCEQLPRFLIVGPQKTGTTALYTFLTMHPSIVSNYPSPNTFEEVQFFNGKNYDKGLDWYMQFFPLTNASANFLFEKTANYFDNEHVPLRASALVPKAKIITILISPTRRAYSWYWHMRLRNDPVARNYSFYEVITASDTSPKHLRDLHNRCINPGHYAQHLERWLDFYPARQIFIIDGDLLKNDPIQVMRKVQHFLRIEPFMDYSQSLKFDKKKGFFCQVINGDSTKCLGRSKGRVYPPIDDVSYEYLKKYYRRHNAALLKLFDKLNQAVPNWLDEEFRDT